MIPRTIARTTEKIGRELNSGAGPSEADIGREHDRGGADGSYRPLGRAKPGIPRNPAQADAIRYPRGELN